MDASSLIFIVMGFTAGVVVVLGGLRLYGGMLGARARRGAKREAERILSRAHGRVSRMKRDSESRIKEQESRHRRQMEQKARKARAQLDQKEQEQLKQQKQLKASLQRKIEEVAQRRKALEHKQVECEEFSSQLKKKQSFLQKELLECQQKLELVANMSRDEALSELKNSLVQQAKSEVAEDVYRLEKKMRKESQDRVRSVWAKTIARYASDVATERTTQAVQLTSDEMKGKIIGREGRNIRSLESACGVDIIVDETPETVIISSFDPLRRQVAHMALEHLMLDGRVHPARIEEVVDKVRRELMGTLKQEAEQVVVDLGLSGFHHEVLSVLGKLKFRHVGEQNVLSHSVEVAYVSGLLAGEIGTSVSLARRAGLLHDIGLGVPHWVEGSSFDAGAKFLKKWGESDKVVEVLRGMAFGSHHQGLLGHLVQAANNFSEARPGTKRSVVENYIRRLSDLEAVGNSFDGVVRTFALQAGKEIRVLVDSGTITDAQASVLSQDIVNKIERELSFTGDIKVSVIRHTRMVEYAK